MKTSKRKTSNKCKTLCIACIISQAIQYIASSNVQVSLTNLFSF